MEWHWPARSSQCAISQVSTAIRQMDEMTQHNAALVEEPTLPSSRRKPRPRTEPDRVEVFVIEDDTHRQVRPVNDRQFGTAQDWGENTPEQDRVTGEGLPQPGQCRNQARLVRVLTRARLRVTETKAQGHECSHFQPYEQRGVSIRGQYRLSGANRRGPDCGP